MNEPHSQAQPLRLANATNLLGGARKPSELETCLAQMQNAYSKQDYSKLLKSAAEASELAQHLIRGDCSNPKPYRLKRAQALGCMGLAYSKQHEYEKAIKLLKESLQIFENEQPKKACIVQQSKFVAQTLAFCQKQVPPSLIKFPRTAHLINVGSATSDDLVLPRVDTFHLNGETQFIIEEKTDGANMGISLGHHGELLVQNRSHYVCAGDHAQYGQVTEWLALHEEALRTILSNGANILYGEWCVARHSIPYQRLPDYFVAFDLYDVEAEQFYSRQRFHQTLRGSGIAVAPTLGVRTFGPFPSPQQAQRHFRTQVERLLETKSRFRSDGGTLEGIVLRVDEGDWLNQRSKIVRPDFIAGCGEGHWMRRAIEKQRVCYEFSKEYLASCYPFADTEPSELCQSTTPAQAQSTTGRPTRRCRVPRCVMLMGLPGSGKTTFSRRLAESSDGWLHVNQDILGRKEALKQAGRASQKQRVVLDRCHPTRREREEWLDAMHSPSPSDVALVCFVLPVEDCVVRVKNRIHHPNIAANTGETAVRRVAESLEPVTAEERKKQFGVYEVVRSHEEADALLQKWGVS